MELLPHELLAAWMLVFLRCSGLFTVFPMFSARTVPARLRTAVALVMALLMASQVPGPARLPDSVWGLMGLMGLEVGVGLLLGFVTRLVFFGLEVAGGIIGNEMGLSLPMSMDAAGGGQSGAPGAVLYYFGIVLWLGLDLHHWLLAAFQRSYDVLPIGGAALNEGALIEVLERCTQLFGIALQIAAPILAVSFIISLTFSVLGRAVPQMNVFSESFAIRILAGLSVFGLTCQLMGQHIANYLGRVPEDLILVARLLARQP